MNLEIPNSSDYQNCFVETIPGNHACGWDSVKNRAHSIFGYLVFSTSPYSQIDIWNKAQLDALRQALEAKAEAQVKAQAEKPLTHHMQF